MYFDFNLKSFNHKTYNTKYELLKLKFSNNLKLLGSISKFLGSIDQKCQEVNIPISNCKKPTKKLKGSILNRKGLK